MSITFADQQYSFIQGRISAVLPDPYWCDTYNHGRGKDFVWNISLYYSDYLSIEFREGLGINVDSWEKLDGFSTKWDKPINPVLREGYGMAAYSEGVIDRHGWINQGEVAISRISPLQFRIQAEGVSEYGPKFTLDDTVEFKKVEVNASGLEDQAMVEARLAESLTLQNLKLERFELLFRPNSDVMQTYKSGIQMATAVYLPTV